MAGGELGDSYRFELHFDGFYCPSGSNCNGLDGCLASHSGFASSTIQDMLNPSFPLLALKGRILADYFKILSQLVFKGWISWYLLQLVDVVATIIDISLFPKMDVLNGNFAQDPMRCYSFSFHFSEDLGFVCF
ncbi:hypothetical protein V6N13_005100 [Hibiscus sabdariffa]|uniref:Uncharacterized protein n=2 Tax=Hibiscus sabdariffa TaxID=183260 RepID=A0ABR2C3R4_9ROSI